MRNDYDISWESGSFLCCTATATAFYSTTVHSDSVEALQIYSIAVPYRCEYMLSLALRPKISRTPSALRCRWANSARRCRYRFGIGRRLSNGELPIWYHLLVSCWCSSRPLPAMASTEYESLLARDTGKILRHIYPPTTSTWLLAPFKAHITAQK